jgi:polysaccharide biosynthesis/export protein
MKALKALPALAACLLAASAALGQQPAQQQQPTPAGPVAQPQQPQTTTDAPVLPPGVAQSMYAARGEYLLGPGDRLELKVFGEPQFDGTFDVDEHGLVAFPFIDEPLVAKCRSVGDVKKEVVVALGKLLRTPRVYLAIKERLSRKPATIYGAVRDARPVDMRRPVRLLELISTSGGVTEQHSGVIQIFHTEPPMCGDPAAQRLAATPDGQDAIGLPFDIYNISDLRQGKPEANPYIRPGDVVNVVEAAPIYVIGNVAQATSLYLREGMTLMRALLTVGGVKEGDESKIKVYRVNHTTKQHDVLTFDFKAIKQGKAKDVALQPFDVIEVPKRGFTAGDFAKEILGFARQGAGYTVAGAPMRIIQ